MSSQSVKYIKPQTSECEVKEMNMQTGIKMILDITMT